MTLEELSVVFSAETAPFEEAVSRLTAMLPEAAAEADALVAHFSAAGVQAAAGLKNGLLSGKSAVVAAAKAVADAAAAALRSALQIHSPSKITYQTGVHFDEGLLSGIESGVSQVENVAAGLGRSAADALNGPAIGAAMPVGSAFTGTAQPAAESFSLTIPLEIDGYRLGIAAIEGINRVTRGTGRVELSL